MLNIRTNQKAVPVTICPLCDETFTDPRILPRCLHTFCLQCLEKHEGSAVVVQSSCPVCGEKYSGPLSDLSRNAFMQKLIRINRIADASMSQPSACDVCQRDESSASPAVVATHYCLNCSESFCDKCHAMHSRIRSTERLSAYYEYYDYLHNSPIFTNSITPNEYCEYYYEHIMDIKIF